MPTVGLHAGDLSQVLRHIGPGKRGVWERRKQLLSIYGRHPEGVELSTRQIEARGLFTRGWARHVVAALVEDRVLVPVWSSAGTRAAAYVVNPRFDQWIGVPWTVTDLRLVAHEVFHEELVAVPEARPVARWERRHRATSATSGAVNGGSPRHNKGLRRGEPGYTAPQGSASGAVNGSTARQWTQDAQNSSALAGLGATSDAGDLGSAAAAESSTLEGKRAAASVERWVKTRIKVPFFKGDKRAGLLDLAAAVGMDALYDAIKAHEPDMSKSPVLRIEDLVDDVTMAVLAPVDERTEALAAAPAATPEPPGPAPASPYREWRPDDDADVPPIEDRQAQLARVREQRRADAQRLESNTTTEVQPA